MKPPPFSVAKRTRKRVIPRNTPSRSAKVYGPGSRKNFTLRLDSADAAGPVAVAVLARPPVRQVRLPLLLVMAAAAVGVADAPAVAPRHPRIPRLLRQRQPLLLR